DTCVTPPLRALQHPDHSLEREPPCPTCRSPSGAGCRAWPIRVGMCTEARSRRIEAAMQNFQVRCSLLIVLLIAVTGCTREADVTPFTSPCDNLSDETARKACYEGHGIRVTFLHTSDWHSRLLPYDLDVLATDERLGLLQSNEPFGG